MITRNLARRLERLEEYLAPLDREVIRIPIEKGRATATRRFTSIQFNFYRVRF
jgi:hypothetical protein